MYVHVHACSSGCVKPIRLSALRCGFFFFFFLPRVFAGVWPTSVVREPGKKKKKKKKTRKEREREVINKYIDKDRK